MKLSVAVFKRRSYRWAVACLLICFLFLSSTISVVTAGPEGAQVVNGQVTIKQSGNNTAITASDKSIINYSSFDIAQPETVRFIQPGSSASVLNRILSANPTNINGTLLANGRVFFVNPAGVYIGNGARINVNQLVASGLNISNADFINGHYNFAGGNGAVINNGDISAQRVYLIGKQVTNSGNINCPAGYVVMAAGERVFLGEPGSDIVLDVEGTSLSDSTDTALSEVGVLNEGTIEAAGGIIVLAAAGDIYSQAISNVGTISASTDTGKAGDIKLTATEGTVTNSGLIEAKSSSGTGGNVQMLGDKVGLFDAGRIDVSGSDGGGTVLVGGDYQGKGDVPTASRTYVGPDSSIIADATENGDGGKVIVWADEITRFYGDISARGGTEAGDGGFVEVSSKGNLDFHGYVDTRAPQGDTGTLLLDPTDLHIEDGGAGEDDASLPDILFAEAAAGTGEPAGVGETSLEALDSDIILQATQDIIIEDLTTDGVLNLANLDTESLVMQAGRHITFNNTSNTITTAGGAIHLEADSPHTGVAGAGDGTGTLTSGNLTSGNGDITLIGADFDLTGATVNAGSGNVNIAKSQSGQALGLGSAAGAILTDAELDNITTTGTLTIGQATTKGTDGAGTGASALTAGAITLDELTQGAKNIALVSNSSINDDDDTGAAITTSGTLSLNSGGAIGNLGGAAGLNTDVGTLALTTTASSDVTVTEADGLDLATSNVSGNLAVTATTGNITDSGTVTVDGTGTFTTSADDATINLDNLAVAGSIVLNTNDTNDDDNGHATIVNSTGVDLGASNVGGNLAVTATTGNITDSGLVTVDGTGTFITSADDATINLDNLAVAGSIGLNTNDTNDDDNGHATIVNSIGVDLGASNVGGNLAVTATTGNITDSGLVTVDGTGTFITSADDATINLDNLAVAGSIGLNTNDTNDDDNGHATIINSTGVDLGASNVGGNLAVTATTGNITDSGAVTVDGTASFTTSNVNDDINLDTLAVAGAIDLTTSGATCNATIANSTGVDLAVSNVGGNLGVTATTGNITDSGIVTVGGNASFTTSADDATINLDTLAVASSIVLNTDDTNDDDNGHATIVNSTGVDLGASNVGGNLAVTATTGNITDSGAVAVDGTASFTTSNADDDIDLGTLAVAGAIDLNTSGATGNATIANSTGVDLAVSNVGGNLGVTATTGNITDSGIVTVGGNASFTTSADDATINLDTLAVTGSIVLNTDDTNDDDNGHATIVNSTGVDLGASNVGGNLAVTATTGNITDSGAVAVDGTASFTTSNANDDIDLGSLAVTGAIDLNTNGATGNATIANSTGVDLALSNVGGNLDVTASTGNITDSGIVTVGGTASFTTSNANDDIDLGTLAVAGAIDLTTSGATGNAAVVNSTGVNLATSNIGGNLGVTATTGNITDSGTVTVGGNASFATSADDATIDLGTLAVAGSILLNTDDTNNNDNGHATIVNSTGVDLGASNVGGNLAVTATTGNITDSGAVTVDGAASFTTSNANDDINLGTLAVAGAIDLTTSGATGNAAIVNSTGVNLATSNIGGNLGVTATTGNITDSGTITVGGTASFATSTANDDINMDTLAATGAIGLNTSGAAGNATIVNSTGVNLATSNVGGALDVTATTGNISDSGTVTVGGTASFATSNANDDIDLGTLAITGAIDLTTSGATGNAVVVNSTGVNLAASNVGGNLGVTATSGNLAISNSITAGNAIDLEATAGAITQSAGTITANGGLLSMTSNSDLNMLNYTVANPGGTDLVLNSTGGSAIVTNSAADDWQSITARAQHNVVLSGDGDITTGNLESVSGSSGVQISTETGSGGSLIAQGTIDAGGFVEVDVDGSASFANTVTAGGDIDLETGGNITARAMTSTGGNIEMESTAGDLILNGALTANAGGVSLVSRTGKIYTPGGSNDTINVPITGYSDSSAGTGVGLPYGSGKTAIMIKSSKDLIIGPGAALTANGLYNAANHDDRRSVDFDTSLAEGGDPLDVAIYLSSSRLDPPIGTITVNSTVQLADNGSMVVDAGEKVAFGDEFSKSVFNQTQRLEVVSRRSTTLNEVKRYQRLPFADYPEAIKSWFTPPGSFTGAYVLRGVKILLAEVLALTNPVPLVPPRPLEPEIRGEVEGPDTEALEKLLNDLGIGVQPYVTEAYANSLSTDLRLYKAAEKLQKLTSVLEDVDGVYIAALREAVAEFFPRLEFLSEEQMDSFTQVIFGHKGDRTNYDLAGQCIFALTEYVNILSTDIGWPVQTSVEFVMGRYVPQLTENDEIRIAVIQMQLQK